MRVVLSSQKGKLTVLVALVLALMASMVVSATVAQAAPVKRAYCHATGQPGKYVLVVVQKPLRDIAHERHARDIKLGRVASRAEARELFERLCTPDGTTTTTGTDTTTTTGTDTTTTTGTGTTTTTGTGTTTTTGKAITTTGKATTTTGKATTTTGTGTTTTTGTGTTTTTGTGTTTTGAAGAVQYQYAAPAAEAELPPTGGSGLLPLAALVLLLGGGAAAFIVAKRGIIG